MKDHHNIDAEKGLLGSILRNNAVMDDVGTIRQEDFYAGANGEIWRAMVDLRAGGHVIDKVTVAELIHSRKRFDDVGVPYLLAMEGEGGNLSHAKACAKIVRDHSLTRVIIATLNELHGEADEGLPPDEVIEKAQQEFFRLAQQGIQGGVVPNSEVIDESMAILENRVALFRRGEMTGAVPYGLRDLDQATAGMHGGELIIVGARPGVGKTILGCHLADVASSKGLPALFISLEQARTELALRLLAKHSGVNAFKVRGGTVSDADLCDLNDAAVDVKNYPLWWDDAPSQTVGRIATQARKLKAKSGLELLVVDYMQLIEAADPKGKRHEQVGAMSRGLKLLARELKIPVVAMAQLNRDSESQNREPRLSDLREAGGIEQDADTVILMHLPSVSMELPNQEIKLLIRKQRNGPLKDVTVIHEKAKYSLVSAAEWLPNP